MLPLGQGGSCWALTRLHHPEDACFAHAFVTSTLAGHLADPQLTAQLTALHYTQRDALWWQVGATQGVTPAAQFFQPLSTLRADGATSSVKYDDYALAVVSATDPLGNTTTIGIDYHQLAASRIVDPNGNTSEVRYDPLGVVVTATTHGTVGSQPWGFDALAAVTPRAPSTLADALASPSTYLQGAAGYAWYDLGAWAADGVPTTVVSLTAEQILHDGAGGGTAGGRIQVGVTYLDGLGRPLQRKTLVEDGPAIQRNAQGNVVVDGGGNPILAQASPRWRASGHVVYDTKEHPGRQYDPFFSPSAAYEGDEIGVSTLAHYDAVGRLVEQDFPNGTFTTTTFGAWTVEEADPNDNVVGSLYGIQRQSLAAGAAELQAYTEAVPDQGTTKRTYLDPLGRQAGTLAQGGSTAADRRTTTQLDIAGAVLQVTDPRGLVAFTYQRDMLGRCFHEQGIDAGDAWSLPDGYGRIATTWDGRGFRVDRAYDLGDRPTHTDVSGGDGATRRSGTASSSGPTASPSGRRSPRRGTSSAACSRRATAPARSPWTTTTLPAA